MDCIHVGRAEPSYCSVDLNMIRHINLDINTGKKFIPNYFDENNQDAKEIDQLDVLVISAS